MLHEPKWSATQELLGQYGCSRIHLLIKWLRTPVDHVRDARSLLLSKLLFLDRGARDPGPLLQAQRKRFVSLAERLATMIAQAGGFDQTLLRWRLETTTAAVRFIDTLADEP